MSAYSSNGGGWSASNLYTFDPQPEAGAEADVPLARSMPTPEQVILIESGTQSTEDLLRDLADTPGVLAAQPDYVRYIDDLETQAKPVEEPAAALSADTAPTDDPLIGLQWHLAPTDVAREGRSGGGRGRHGRGLHQSRLEGRHVGESG